jgi:hypothetical protein
LVPPELELDLYDGQAYVGIVPFQIALLCESWWPKAAAMSFLETNVRTYVRYQGRPGVYFLSLDAASTCAVVGARFFWGLPYFPA